MSKIEVFSERKVENSLSKFINWLEQYGDKSYDRMDFWSSKPGILVKKIFYKNKLVGFPFAALAQIQHVFFPSLLKLYAKPRREAIGDAHYAMGFLTLYEYYGEEKYLTKAESYLEALKGSASTDYSGYCWGYTFDWQQPYGCWPSGTPLMTITPYAFWAFKKHYQVTSNKESLDICLSVPDFAIKDLNKIKMANGTICTSYSPLDESQIINANTYRAALLLDAFEMSDKDKTNWKKEAKESIEFVLSYQNKDGSWNYEAKDREDTFIDNFHTCFVLRNLYRCYRHLDSEELLKAIRLGYSYYRANLFRNDNTPIHFSNSKYPKFRKYEMYDYAEGIKLGILLDKEINGALNFSKGLAKTLVNQFQLKEGYFVTRVTPFGNAHTIPYHRWPQAQLFCALSRLLNSI